MHTVAVVSNNRPYNLQGALVKKKQFLTERIQYPRNCCRFLRLNLQLLQRRIIGFMLNVTLTYTTLTFIPGEL